MDEIIYTLTSAKIKKIQVAAEYSYRVRNVPQTGNLPDSWDHGAW